MSVSTIGIAIRVTLLLTVLTGVVYPGVVTGFAQLVFPAQANGSLLSNEGQFVGSALIGQRFTRPEYVQPRPSAAGGGYDALASSGSNAGPMASRLVDSLRARRNAAISLDGSTTSFPADLLTASSSGLDPHVSPASARRQLPRVARARGVPIDSLEVLLARLIEPRSLGVFGEPRVNVLRLNLALDSLSPIR